MPPKWLRFRYQLFRYRLLERAIAQEMGAGRMLDVGCGDGENLLRFEGVQLERVGIDPSPPRLRKARRAGLSVARGAGEGLAFPSGCFDLIYVAHVLHHVSDHEQVLAEIGRCLAPDGVLFVLETVTDHPLVRLGRVIRPSWRGDPVEADWDYSALREIVSQAGFRVERSGRYNLLFWLWEMAPLALWPLEVFTPVVVYLDLLLARWLARYSAHCYLVLKHASAADHS